MREIWLAQRPLVLAVAFGFGLWILVQLLAQALWVLVLVLLAAILAAAMMPIVRVARSVKLPPRGWRIPKALAVVFIYLFALAVISAIVSVVGGLLATEVNRFIEALPVLARELGDELRALEQELALPAGVAPSPQELAMRAETLASAMVDMLGRFIEGLIEFIFHLFIVLTLALFLVVESERVLGLWLTLFPSWRRARVRELTLRIRDKIGFWLLGQLTVAVIVGVLAGLGAAVIGLPYPVLFGVATGILELAPVLGPTLMAIPALLVGLTLSPLHAVAAALFFFALAQFDANVLSPLITGRAVRLSPTLIIIAVPVGLALYGPIGALVAIPVTAGLQVLTTEVFLPWLHEHQEASRRGEDGPSGNAETDAAGRDETIAAREQSAPPAPPAG